MSEASGFCLYILPLTGSPQVIPYEASGLPCDLALCERLPLEAFVPQSPLRLCKQKLTPLEKVHKLKNHERSEWVLLVHNTLNGITAGNPTRGVGAPLRPGPLRKTSTGSLCTAKSSPPLQAKPF